MSNIITRREIKYNSGSVCDKLGRVFSWQGRIFREINKNYEDRVTKFLSSELFKILIEKKYIPFTKISDYSIENENIMLLEHEKIQPSAPSDWSFSMLKDASLFLLKLNELLKKYGYNLWDGHLWNVCFHNNQPMFIDFGSIVSAEEGSYFEQEFIHTCCYPLILFSQQESYLAKALLSSPSCIYQRTIPSHKIEENPVIRQCIRKYFNGLKFSNRFHKIKKLEKQLLDPLFIEKHINNNMLAKTMWDDYQNDFFKEIEAGKLHERFSRFEKIKNYMQTYCPDAKSVTDLAGNQGGICYYLEKNIPQLQNLVSIDYDEKAIESAYKYFKTHKTKLNIILGNFMLPIRESFSRAYQSDVVLALAVTHHLILSQGFHLSSIFETIKSYSNKYVFIEFMPWGLWGGGDKPSIPDWYTQDWFRKIFEQYFTLLHIEDFGMNRILFIGKIK